MNELTSYPYYKFSNISFSVKQNIWKLYRLIYYCENVLFSKQESTTFVHFYPRLFIQNSFFISSIYFLSFYTPGLVLTAANVWYWAPGSLLSAPDTHFAPVRWMSITSPKQSLKSDPTPFSYFSKSDLFNCSLWSSHTPGIIISEWLFELLTHWLEQIVPHFKTFWSSQECFLIVSFTAVGDLDMVSCWKSWKLLSRT